MDCQTLKEGTVTDTSFLILAILTPSLGSPAAVFFSSLVTGQQTLSAGDDIAKYGYVRCHTQPWQ